MQLNLQLYGRTTQTGFNEQLSERQAVTLSPDPRTVELALAAPGKEDFVELRLDPNNAVSTFLLSALRVNGADGGLLYVWDGRPDSLVGATDLRAGKHHEQVVIDCVSEDPFMLLPLSRPTRSVIVQLTVSSRVSNVAQEELADAVRALQTSLRLAIDDLASEQEGLQDALLIEQSRGRAKDEQLSRRLSEVLDRTNALGVRAIDLDGALNKLDVTLGDTARQTRDSVLSEVRDDWRSLRRHISESADTIVKQGREATEATAIKLALEVAKLTETVNRAAQWQETLNALKHELHVLHHQDALGKVRQLKADADTLRAKLETMENSLAWRLTHPFAARSSRNQAN